MKKNPKLSNKGFILMTTLMVGTVLTVLSGAYFAASLSQSNIARRQFVSIQEFYDGGSMVSSLSLDALDDVLTHKIVDLDSGELAAEPSGTSKFSAISTDADGNLILNRRGRVIAKGKIYQKEADTIILVRAVDINGNEVGPVHRYVFSRKSLYKYFLFYANGISDDYRWNPGSSSYLGKLIDVEGAPIKVGGIHVNGDISLSTTAFINLSEVSASRDFYYSHDPDYDLLKPAEPSYWDSRRWLSAPDRKTWNYYSLSSCGPSGGCWIDGKAALPRSSTGLKDFTYPLPKDILGLGTGGVLTRDIFHHPDMWVLGYDVTDDWNGGSTPKNYGTSYFWMDPEHDSDEDGILDNGEIKRIPKILVSSGGNYDKNAYSGEPGDNRIQIPPTYWNLSTSAPPNCDEPSVRFEVVGTEATISNPTGVDAGLANKYEALRWLADKEELAGEYSVLYSDWLTTTYKNDYKIPNDTCTASNLTNGRWEACEYDRVTILSLEPEAGTDGLISPFGKGLYGNSEYDVYKAVKQYATIGTFPVGIAAEVQAWISGGSLQGIDLDFSDLRDDFWAWWIQRRYHHKEDLGLSGGSFSSDTSTVPAWERLFWEAWLNYWPPTRGKAHNDIYLPAHAYHAINPEWWEDLVAGTNRPASGQDETRSVPYFNTVNDVQAEAFADWLESRGMYDPDNPGSSIVKFRNHGGEYLNPLNIRERYSSLAQSYGLYIIENANGTFSAKLNGSLVADGLTLADCLDALVGLSPAWIYEKEFYNPYTITRSKDSSAKNVYDPSQKDTDEVDTSKSTVIYPIKQIYGDSYGVDECPASLADAKPLPVKVIEIDLSLLKTAVTFTQPIIYIESLNYDTRLVNGYSLPSGDETLANPGGFTLASPYDVYVKAQKVPESGVDKGYFNYESVDRTSSSQDLDDNFRPAAVITNSRVYLLSSEFKDMSDDFPYSYDFPNAKPATNNSFLQEYCWNIDSYTPAKPAVNLYTTAWFGNAANRTVAQQSALVSAGQLAYDNEFGPLGGSNEQVNVVGYNQYFNLAIASPFEPRGYRLERWANNEAHAANVTITLEGAYIKIGFWKNSDDTSVLSRYHTPASNYLKEPIACYEEKRFNIGYGKEARGLKVYNNSPTSASAKYEYEERFWNPYERPAGDFLASGNQRRWDQLSGTDENFNNDTML